MRLKEPLYMTFLQTEFSAFWSDFCHCMKYAMVVFKREPAVERVIDFISKFAPSLSKGRPEEEKEGDNEDEEEKDSVGDNRLLQEIFDFLLDVSTSSCPLRKCLDMFV